MDWCHVLERVILAGRSVLHGLGAAWLSILGNIVVTGLAAFGGAWAAFLFENRRERRRQEDDHYRALSYAHFVMLTQYQELITIRDRHLGPLEAHDDAWARLHPLEIGSPSPPLKVAELTFVLEGPDPDLLNRLMLGQQRYEAVRGAISSRNQLHAELQRRAAALEIKGVTGGAPDVLLGKDLVAQVKDLTADLYKLLAGALELLKGDLDGLSDLCRSQFPDRRCPKFEVLPLSERR